MGIGIGIGLDRSRVLGNSGNPIKAALETDAVAYWKMDEASDGSTNVTRVDSAGSNDLTSNNTVPSATGKVGNAASFTAANTEDLRVADNTEIAIDNDTTFTFTGWFYTTATNVYILTKRDGFTNGILVDYTDSNLVRMRIYNSSSSTSATVGGLSTSTWYFFVVSYDAVTDEMAVELNRGTPGTNTQVGGVGANAGVLILGSADGFGHLSGRIDEVLLLKRILTEQEKDYLYNSGNGRTLF